VKPPGLSLRSTTGQHHAADRDHIHVADGLADHREGVVAYRLRPEIGLGVWVVSEEHDRELIAQAHRSAVPAATAHLEEPA
jgi:hypothetical protein